MFMLRGGLSGRIISQSFNLLKFIKLRIINRYIFFYLFPLPANLQCCDYFRMQGRRALIARAAKKLKHSNKTFNRNLSICCGLLYFCCCSSTGPFFFFKKQACKIIRSEWKCILLHFCLECTVRLKAVWHRLSPADVVAILAFDDGAPTRIAGFGFQRNTERK